MFHRAVHEQPSEFAARVPVFGGLDEGGRSVPRAAGPEVELHGDQEPQRDDENRCGPLQGGGQPRPGDAGRDEEDRGTDQQEAVVEQGNDTPQEQGVPAHCDGDEASSDPSHPKPADEEPSEHEGEKGREHGGHEAQWVERQVDPSEARDPRDDTLEDEADRAFPSLGPVRRGRLVEAAAGHHDQGGVVSPSFEEDVDRASEHRRGENQTEHPTAPTGGTVGGRDHGGAHDEWHREGQRWPRLVQMPAHPLAKP